MKHKLPTFVFLSILASLGIAATVKFSALTPIGTIAATNTIPVTVNGVTNLCTSFSNLASNLATNAAFTGYLITNVGGFTAIETATLECDTAGAYANGDTWANIVTLPNSVRLAGGKGMLCTFSLLSADDTSPELSVLVFSRPFSCGATNAAWAVSSAEMAYCLGGFAITAADYVDLGGNRLATRLNLNFAVNNTWTNTALYLGIIARDATQVTNAPVCTAGILQD